MYLYHMFTIYRNLSLYLSQVIPPSGARPLCIKMTPLQKMLGAGMYPSVSNMAGSHGP